jgi:hypothetical protein
VHQAELPRRDFGDILLEHDLHIGGAFVVSPLNARVAPQRGVPVLNRFHRRLAETLAQLNRDRRPTAVDANGRGTANGFNNFSASANSLLDSKLIACVSWSCSSLATFSGSAGAFGAFCAHAATLAAISNNAVNHFCIQIPSSLYYTQNPCKGHHPNTARGGVGRYNTNRESEFTKKR